MKLWKILILFTNGFNYVHYSDQLDEAMAVGIGVKKAVQTCPAEPEDYSIKEIHIERITRIEYEDLISEGQGQKSL